MPEAETTKHLTHAFHRIVHVEPILDPLLDRGKRPAGRLARIRVGASFNLRHQLRSLARVQLPWTARAWSIAQTIQALGVVAHDPVAQGLDINTNTTRNLAPRQLVLNDQCDRPQTNPAVPVLVLRCQRA